MRLRNMLKICLVFWESEPQYAYKRYAYKKNMYPLTIGSLLFPLIVGKTASHKANNFRVEVT